MWGSSWKKICFGLFGLFLFGSVFASGEGELKVQVDSVRRNNAFSEYLNVYKTRKVSSVYPVDIKKKGSSLLVTSRHSQMLPVYKDNGVFYGLFRLNKGTNWISGLPRGTYIINNSKFTLS